MLKPSINQHTVRREQCLQSQLFHADSDYTSHNGAHTKGRDVQTGRYFDADGEYGDDTFKD